MVAAALKFAAAGIFLGGLQFRRREPAASMQFDNPVLPIDDEAFYRIMDPLYSPITGHYSYFTGRELRISQHQHRSVSFTERVKILRLERLDAREPLRRFSERLLLPALPLDEGRALSARTSPSRDRARLGSLRRASVDFMPRAMLPLLWKKHRHLLELGLKRALFHVFRFGTADGGNDARLHRGAHGRRTMRRCADLGRRLAWHNERGAPGLSRPPRPSRSPRAAASPTSSTSCRASSSRLGEEVCVITPLFRSGDSKAVKKHAPGGGAARDRLHRHERPLLDRRGTNTRSGCTRALSRESASSCSTTTSSSTASTGASRPEEKLRRRIAFARAAPRSSASST